jgi:hypothetical protein
MTPQSPRERFDPYAVLAALDRARVTYIVVGALARIIQGADEITRGIDITVAIRDENLRRLDEALKVVDARRVDGDGPSVLSTDFEYEPVLALRSDAGDVKVVPYPAGTRGYEDLRRAAERQPIGQGLRPLVASAGDLARMLNALQREQDIPKLIMMRRLAELENARHRGLSIER